MHEYVSARKYVVHKVSGKEERKHLRPTRRGALLRIADLFY